jgi:type II secretory pathway pseudopilin PulG
VGVTLLELLIVMGLLTLLASISLTAARGLMRGNKVAEAATIVQQYLQNAQVRAITNGRPVAVFLDRVSPAGDSVGNPVPANYTVNRLQLGEVFPPYMGDQLGTQGELRDVHISPIRPSDNHADEIVFSSVDVQSGLLQPNGFVKRGDLIEFVGHEGIFRIESISPPDSGLITVRFFNPPATYNAASAPSDIKSSMPTLLPLTTAPKQVSFRIYRQPTKSLAGSVALPRGACVDLSLSGIGPRDSIVSGSATLRVSSFASQSLGNFSRVGVVFDSQGRMSYLLHELMNDGALVRAITPASSTLYLMVGRSDQVLPGFPSNPGNLNVSYETAITNQGADGVPPSNLLDTENVWITCNPFTGEVRSAPVADTGNGSNIENMISQSRRLAAAGMRN